MCLSRLRWNVFYIDCVKSGVFCVWLKALWTMEPKDVTDDMHEEFYRFIANVYDRPRYALHYKTDAPLNIRALFYVPEYKPSKCCIMGN